MPVETSKYIHEVAVETTGKDALEQLLGAINKVEQAVVTMGERFDTAMGKVAEPINRLTTSVDALSASIGGMQRNLGDVSGLEAQQKEAQQLTVDYANLRQAMTKFRQVGGAPEQERYRGPTGSQIKYGRKGFVEAYMGGEYTQQGFGPGMGGVPATGPLPPPTMQLQYETAEAAARGLGISIEELGAKTQKTTADLGVQAEMLQKATAVAEMVESGLITRAKAEAFLATNIRQTTEATRQLTQAEKERWLAMGRMPPGLGKGVSGTYAPPELRKPAMQEVLRGQMGTRPELEWERAYGPKKEVLPHEPLRRAEYFGEMEAELEQIQSLETAIGRKIVVQKLMERGSRDVAERFEKQFTVTRSKEEILREINRTGVMTAEMEKELGLQAETAGRRAGRASNMFRYFGRYLLRYLLLWQGIQAVRGISRSWFAAHMEMADAVADFGWRVNTTAEDVDRYRDKLRDVSMMAGVPVGQIASPFAGEMAEGDLLRATEAFKVFGGSVEDWARKIDSGTASLDAYAHGLRISTLATEDYAKLVDNASDIAKEFNMTEEETIGLLSALPSVLRTDAEGAAELTEALAGLYEQNQLLMTLGVAPAVTVGPGGAPQRRPMAEVIAEIGRQPVAQQRQLAVAIGLTSEAQQQLFLDAVAGWAEVQQAIQGTVDATGDMVDALAGADESMKAHTDSMKTAWSSLMESIGATQFIKDAIDILTMSFKGWSMMIEEVGKGLEALKEKAGWLEAFLPAWMQVPGTLHAIAELYRGEEAAARAAARTGGEPGRGYAGVTPGTEPPGAAYFPPMPTLRLGEGMGIGQLAAEMERVIDEVFTRPYTTASGEVIQVTKEQIDALRKNTVILDETGEAIGLLNAYAPALSMATENLKTEVARFNLERLKDVTPEQFDAAMRTTLPMWEARLGAIPGFEEKKELQTFFVGEQDVLRQQLATQTAMSYTLQDILDVEKDQLEGMWNIPSGVTMRVPLQSLDLMRWMQQGAGGGVATDMMIGPGGALEAAATAQDVAAQAMTASAGAQTQASASMSALAQSVGAAIYGGVPVEPGVAKAEAAMKEPQGGLRQNINRGRPIAGGAGKVIPPVPIGTAGVGALAPLSAQFIINLVSTLLLDGKVVAETVEPHLSRKMVNTSRSAGGSMGGMRP